MTPLKACLGDHAEGTEAGKPLDDQLSAVLLSMSETDRDLARARLLVLLLGPSRFNADVVLLRRRAQGTLP